MVVVDTKIGSIADYFMYSAGMEAPPLHIWLHNIRSVHNVGSIFRTADAVGASNIILSGYTPAPIDRFGRPRKDLAKVSLGAEDTVSWQYYDTADQVMDYCRSAGLHIMALEQDPRSVDYKAVDLKQVGPAVLLLGTETTGIESKLLNEAETIIEIPMQGQKESLNVAVAAGIVLYRLLDVS